MHAGWLCWDIYASDSSRADWNRCAISGPGDQTLAITALSLAECMTHTEIEWSTVIGFSNLQKKRNRKSRRAGSHTRQLESNNARTDWLLGQAAHDFHCLHRLHCIACHCMHCTGHPNTEYILALLLVYLHPLVHVMNSVRDRRWAVFPSQSSPVPSQSLPLQIVTAMTESPSPKISMFNIHLHPCHIY